mmetsp:Transcript_77032/g.156847  ORF Transcript_77032/g.156847 Transcript_77032/m.156847 type:complete len:241 (-) Transcript_77032:308-1030(-)
MDQAVGVGTHIYEGAKGHHPSHFSYQLLPNLEGVDIDPGSLDVIHQHLGFWIASIGVFPLNEILSLSKVIFYRGRIELTVIREFGFHLLALFELLHLLHNVVNQHLLLALVFDVLHRDVAFALVLLNQSSVSPTILRTFGQHQISLFEVLQLWLQIFQVCRVFGFILQPHDVEAPVAVVLLQLHAVVAAIVVEFGQGQLPCLVFRGAGLFLRRLRWRTGCLLLLHFIVFLNVDNVAVALL